jgi:hypothetical protein
VIERGLDFNRQVRFDGVKALGREKGTVAIKGEEGKRMKGVT